MSCRAEARFFMAVLAGAFLGTVVWNSLKLDGIQRTFLGIAIVALSDFAAYTIHRERTQIPEALFAVRNPFALLRLR